MDAKAVAVMAVTLSCIRLSSEPNIEEAAQVIMAKLIDLNMR